MSSQLERLQAATKPTRVTAVTATVTTPTGAGWRLLAFNSENAHKLALTGAGWRWISALGAGGPRFESGRPDYIPRGPSAQRPALMESSRDLPT